VTHAEQVNLIELLGYSAATLTTLAFVPQVIETWRSKSSDDLSLGTLSAFTVGVLLWLLYGAALRDSCDRGERHHAGTERVPLGADSASPHAPCVESTVYRLRASGIVAGGRRLGDAMP
jgi:MtN3 and saliva related transmembrane protein